MNNFLYITVFAKEFCFFIKFYSFAVAVKSANTFACIAVHAARLKQAFDRGARDYISDVKLENNPFEGTYATAWEEGWQHEKLQWEWKSNVPEFLRKQA